MAGPGIGYPILASNVANWIPIVWAKEVQDIVKSALVLGGLFDRSYEGYAAFGNKIVVPKLAEITAQAVNFEQMATTYHVAQNAENITIDKIYDIAVMMDDLAQVETNPKYFEKVRDTLAYGLAKRIDINCATTANEGTTYVGTLGSALTEDVLISAYEALNSYDAPQEKRAWVFDPESISDLMKNDYFIRMDYVSGSVVQNGFQGKQIFGAPVYMTTNLCYYGTTLEHMAAYFQKEAYALVVQLPARFEVGRVGLQHSDFITGLAAFGLKAMRPNYGVVINTRS